MNIKYNCKGTPPNKKNVYIWALPKLRFDPPYCANLGTLWHNFFAENEKILKTAILTLGINISKVTMVKKLFLYGILMEIMVHIEKCDVN